MTTFTLRSGAHHGAKRQLINPLHLLVRGLYLLAGLAALGSVYTRLQILLADPIFSAIGTLMLALAFLVIAAPRSRRP